MSLVSKHWLRTMAQLILCAAAAATNCGISKSCRLTNITNRKYQLSKCQPNCVSPHFRISIEGRKSRKSFRLARLRPAVSSYTGHMREGKREPKSHGIWMFVYCQTNAIQCCKVTTLDCPHCLGQQPEHEYNRTLRLRSTLQHLLFETTNIQI